VDAGERDAFLAVLASPVDAAGVRALLSRVTGDATTDEPVGAAPRLPAVVAVLSTGMDGAELEIVAPRGVMLRDGDLDDVAPTLAELAGWPSPGGAGTSLVAR